MTSTDTRSIAEIIGWTFCPESGRWTTGNGTWRYWPALDPDDLLAWLRNRDYTLTITTWRHPSINVWVTNHGKFVADVRAPTLLEALEAAVRVVAEDEG